MNLYNPKLFAGCSATFTYTILTKTNSALPGYKLAEAVEEVYAKIKELLTPPLEGCSYRPPLMVSQTDREVRIFQNEGGGEKIIVRLALLGANPSEESKKFIESVANVWGNQHIPYINPNRPELGICRTLTSTSIFVLQGEDQ